MTTTPVYPPPPPPPPSQPAPPSATTFDFARPFSFVFEDPEWVRKVLIGGLVYLAASFIIGIPFLGGYMMRLAQNIVRGVALPLPEWDDLGTYFSDGLKLVVVGLAYSLPIILLILVMIVPAIIAGEHNSDIAGGFMGCGFLFVFPLMLVLWFFLPLAMGAVMVTGRVGAAFDFANLFALLKRQIMPYLLAIVVHILAQMIGQFGVILLCIGVIFTAFWSLLISTYAIAQVFRIDMAQANR